MEQLFSFSVRSKTFVLPRDEKSLLLLLRDEVGYTADAEIKGPSVENPEIKGSLPVKPGVCQNAATHATPAARDLFLSNFYLPIHSPAFFQKKKKLSRVVPELVVANSGPYMCGPAQ